MPDFSLPALAERLGLTSEDIQPNAGVIAYAPWDNTNTIQKNQEFYNPDAAKIAKDCIPELDFIHYACPSSCTSSRAESTACLCATIY